MSGPPAAAAPPRVNVQAEAQPVRRTWAGAIGGVLVVLAGWAAGMWLMFNPTLASGFAHIQGDWSDPRLNNYILEHGYRWLLGLPGHRSLWSPPVFFPAPNTAAYSDILLGVAPPYWLWRVVGFAPDTAYQLWVLTLASLNYAAAVVCCRRLLRVGWTAASFGAFVFAFTDTRIAQVNHAQLIGQFYMLTACYALVRIFEDPSDARARTHTDARRPWWIAVAGASLVLQLWAGYYLGWFLAFAVALGVGWSAVLPARRRRLGTVLRESHVAIGLTALGSELALIPLALPYLRAASDVGLRTYDNVTWYLPRIWSWIYLGRESWQYGWMYTFPAIRSTPQGQEHRLGVGLVTTVVAVIGLWLARRRPVVQLLCAVAITIVLLATIWPNGMSAWMVVYHVVPGAAAIRGVSRIGLVLLIPAGVGAALLAERLRGQPLALVLLAIAMAGEQRQQLEWIDKAEGRRRVAVITSAIPPRCVAFLYTPPTGHEDPWWYQTDAMWASMVSGVPTLNGYSGNVPPKWPFYHNYIVNPSHGRELISDLLRWSNRWSLDRARVCQIITPAPE
jgi:hypothetical protein